MYQKERGVCSVSKITLHNDSNLSATYVSNYFIDHYMTTANGEYVKVYLYLLRCMGSSDCSFSISSAADKFEHTEKDINRALRYWEKMQLLHLEYDQNEKISGIQLITPENAPLPQAPADKTAVSSGTPEKKTEQPSYTAAQLDAFREKEDVQELLFVTEHYLKKPLTPTDINTLLFWYDELHFPVNLIEYLVESCVSAGHMSIRYMNRKALGWHEDGIKTLEQAKQNSSAFSKQYRAVMRAFGIQGRNLIPSETAYLDKWFKNFGFTQDIVEEACRRTIAAIQKPSFDYADSILTNWHDSQVHHLADIARVDSTYAKTRSSANANRKAQSANRFNNFSQRSYDYEKLEQQLLSQNNA